jgi:hypothetical protein
MAQAFCRDGTGLDFYLSYVKSIIYCGLMIAVPKAPYPIRAVFLNGAEGPAVDRTLVEGRNCGQLDSLKRD